MTSYFQRVRGILVCSAWYFSIISGFYVLYCPVMYLLIINHKIYRKAADHLFAFWELYPVALFQWCNKLHLHHYGDYVDPDESIIIVMNHRTRVDWNYIWIALYHAIQKPQELTEDLKINVHNDNPKILIKNISQDILRACGGKSKIKFVLKDEIKNVPGLGWIMQLNYFLYIKRNWTDDQQAIHQFVDYYNKMQSNVRLVLFPEGTDLSENNKLKSDRFAIANNLPPFEYVLYPRTTGWAVLSSQLKKTGLKAVYDVTVAYDAPAQTETDLVSGLLPKHAHFVFKRYPAEELPNDEDSLRIWLNERWSEKEKNLKIYHNSGKFSDISSNKAPVERRPRSLLSAKVAFIFWNLVDLIFIFLIYTSGWFRFWVIYHSFLLIFVTRKFDGFHNVQYKML